MSRTTATPYDRGRALAGVVSVSTISFVDALGGMRMVLEGEDGQVFEHRVPGRSLFSLAEFPQLVAERTGISSIEICQVQTDHDGSGLDPLASALTAASSRVVAFALDTGNVASPDPERRAHAVALIRRWFQIAERLSVPFVRVPMGARRGAANFDRGAQIDTLRELAEIGWEHGVNTLVENGNDIGGVIDLIESVGRDRLGLVLDTGNVDPMLGVYMARLRGEAVDEAAVDFEPAYVAVERLAPYATMLHTKVHDVAPDGTFGPLDVRRMLTIVRDSGFRGPITVECEGRSTGDDRWSDVRSGLTVVEEIFGRTAPSW